MAAFVNPSPFVGPNAVTTAKQDAFQFAQDLGAFCSTLRDVLSQAQGLAERQTARNYTGLLLAQQTYAVNADGSVGATDGSPNNANPIVGLNVAGNDIDAAMGYLVNDLITMLTGSGSIAQPADRRSALSKLVQ